MSDDGYTVAPGKQVLTGPEIATYYMVYQHDGRAAAERRPAQGALPGHQPPGHLRHGLRGRSQAGHRHRPAGYRRLPCPISGRTPSTTWSRPSSCLEKAGYPDGEGLPELTLGFNTGAGHEDVLALVQADLEAIGIKAELEGVEWAQWLDQMDADDFQVGRLGWSATTRSWTTSSAPLFQTDSLDNHAIYNNPAVDQAIIEARADR